MEIHRALEESAKEMGWTVTRLAAEAGVTEAAARRWVNASTTISGDRLMTLVGKMPGLKARLFAKDRGERGAA